ncbi:amidohydrolase [Senegalia massiliensis]|uniref:amidohydrolase n=1 Tax=Senegalia massiliensis TaxID=1720316 RepID=UPI00102FFDB3|nr:amidohydrolase [Senegalia massiliensis]
MKKKFWLKNVLIEKGFEKENGEIIDTNTENKNFLIENGVIKKIENYISEKCDVDVIDVKGSLALPSFADMHIHLDKGHYGGPWKASTPFKSVFHRIKEEEEFLEDFLPHTEYRAKKLLDLITSNGVTHARVQGNVDPITGIKNIEIVKKALEDYSDKLTHEMVAFPQHGLLRSNSIKAMKEAMRSGVEVVGGLDPATIDNNINGSLEKMMDIAVEFDSDVDIHLHEPGYICLYTMERLADFVEKAKWNGRVTVSHAYGLGELSIKEINPLIEKLKYLDITISSTSPIDVSSPPLSLLYERGVNINVVNDNINDHWSPFGTGDLLQRASRMAEKFGWIDEYSLSRALGFITRGKMPLDKYGSINWPKVGDKADMVFIDCESSAEAIARIPKRKAVMFNGSIVYGIL